MSKNKITKIYIASDHRGVGLKIYLVQMLIMAGYDVVNMGVDDPNTPVDFPIVTRWVTDEMLNDKNARGIVICGFGGGVQIAANRFKHIRATRVNNPDQAKHDRIHDDINVLALAADDMDDEVAFLCATAFLETEFDATERRVKRLELIS